MPHAFHLLRGPLAAILAACALLIPVATFAQETCTLTTLTVEQAREIAASKPKLSYELYGTFVSFDGLTTLSPEVAEVLITIKHPLSFNGLTDLSPETAAALAKQTRLPHSGAIEGKTGHADLRLNGITRLSPAAAEALAAHQGKLLLHSLETLDSLPLAQKFAREPGELRLGLTMLSPAIAAELAKNRGENISRFASILRLDNIERLSPEAAEALAAHEGVLVLNGLTTLEPAVAAALAERVGNRQHGSTGTLILNGLTLISAESATALAKFPGELVLKGITDLTPEAAAALAAHKGRLHLTGLTTLGESTRATLQAHANILLPRPLPAAQAPR
jgi:hypothetical protein